jgi:BirA family biotin operon repressor/biotin-[acetyl-CoA-carboxylase] ligase
VADSQTQGRGRHSEHWVSPNGGLWLSIIIPPQLTVQETLWAVQFLAANVILEAICRTAKLSLFVKWPNDIVTLEGKVAGILVETKTLANSILYVIVGIGINVNLSMNEIPSGAVSLSQILGKKVSKELLLQNIIRTFRRKYNVPLDVQSTTSYWWTHCIHRNRMIKVKTEDAEIIEGVNTGIGPHGELIVRTESGVRSIQDGRLSLI